MAYVSNHTAEIGIRARQRAALEAEQRAFLRRGGKITEVPGFTAIPPRSAGLIEPQTDFRGNFVKKSL